MSRLTTQPVTPPTIKPVSSALALQTLRDELARTVTDSSAEIAKFLQSLQPAIEEAIASGDVTSLRYLKDQITMHIGRASLGAIYKSKEAVEATIMTTVSLLIKVGIGALAA